MKALAFPLMFLLSFFIIIGLNTKLVLAAGEISISFNPTETVVSSGDTQTVVATITNNQDKADVFSITILASSYSGMTAYSSPDRVSINAHSSQQVKISFSASECVEEFNRKFDIEVQSLSKNEIKATGSVTVTTERTFQVCISEIKFDKDFVQPGQAVTITVTITNPAESNSLPVTLTILVKSISGDTLQTFTDNIETVQGRGTSQISHQYTFGQFSSSGSYTFQIVLKDGSGKTIVEKSTYFRVGSIEKITQTKDIAYGFLSQKIIIKIRNDGNEAASNVIVKETVPAFMKIFFFPKDAPSSESTTGSQTVYTWLIPSILPGEEKQITYELAVWNAVLVIVAIILLVLIAFKYVFTIRISKSYKKFITVAGAKEIQVLLEVKNRMRHVLKDVIVRDYLPASASVIEKFDTLQPTIKKTMTGTELVWKFETLRPHEERVITYRIKPAMEIVGEIRLPTANVHYMNHHKEYRKSVSKHLIIRI